MKAHMFIDGQMREIHWCDTASHEPRFATVRLGWSASAGSDYCPTCAATWRAYAAQLGGDVTVQMLPGIRRAQAVAPKRGIA